MILNGLSLLNNRFFFMNFMMLYRFLVLRLSSYRIWLTFFKFRLRNLLNWQDFFIWYLIFLFDNNFLWLFRLLLSLFLSFFIFKLLFVLDLLRLAFWIVESSFSILGRTVYIFLNNFSFLSSTCRLIFLSKISNGFSLVSFINHLSNSRRNWWNMWPHLTKKFTIN